MSSPGAAASRRARLLLGVSLLASALGPGSAAPQVPAEPVLVGQVLVGDSALGSGTVVLHRVSPDAVAMGEIDSVAVASDGSFIFRMPRVPDPASDEMYFASIRYEGVMYFGDAITRPVDLDSLYVIHAFDTIVAPTAGVEVPVLQRSVIFEASGSGFAVFDVFVLRNDRDRTVVPSPDGYVWRYPLPAGARNVMAEEEISADIVTREGDDIVLRAALPPGERWVAVRYELDSLTVPIPTPGQIEAVGVLVREPAPSLEVDGLTQIEDYQDGLGNEYRQFVGQNLARPSIRVLPVEESGPPPVQWIAVVLALVLAAGGLVAFRTSSKPADSVQVRADGRQAILLELAKLDEAYESEASPSSARTREYKRRRAELMGRLRR